MSKFTLKRFLLHFTLYFAASGAFWYLFHTYPQYARSILAVAMVAAFVALVSAVIRRKRQPRLD